MSDKTQRPGVEPAGSGGAPVVPVARERVQGRRPWWRREGVRSWAKVILLILVIRWLWFEPFSIPSGSMEPTIHGDKRAVLGDRVAVNKLAYGTRIPFTRTRIMTWGAPRRWDVVVFNSVPGDPEPKVLIKRVVGLPGERVHIADRRIYINGVAQDLPATMPPVQYTTYCEPDEAYVREVKAQVRPEHWEAVLEEARQRDRFRYGVREEDAYSLVPPGHYFVLGDNSGRSEDGRVWGWVPEAYLIGRAYCVWWPLGHWRDLSGFTRAWWGPVLLWGIPLALLAYELVSAFLIRSFRISDREVGGLLRRGDRILVDRLAFGTRLPLSGHYVRQGRQALRGELVVCSVEGEGGGSLALGRAAALPGEHVRIEGGRLLVGGAPAGWAGHGLVSCADDGGLASAEGLHLGDDEVVVVVSGEDGERPDRALRVCRDGLVGPVVSIWWPWERRARLGVAAPGGRG